MVPSLHFAIAPTVRFDINMNLITPQAGLVEGPEPCTTHSIRQACHGAFAQVGLGLSSTGGLPNT